MKVDSINNTNFQGLYKIDRKYLGDNTKQFFQDNPEVLFGHEPYERDMFVLTPDDKDEKFEESIKQDNGKYFKSRPLPDLMMYPLLLKEIFHANTVRNNYKEDWVDYTDNWEPSVNQEDDIPF